MLVKTPFRVEIKPSMIRLLVLKNCFGGHKKNDRFRLHTLTYIRHFYTHSLWVKQRPEYAPTIYS